LVDSWSECGTRLMDASILVVGDSGFLAGLRDMIPELAKFTVEVVPNPREATPLIQAQQPDLLLIQASQPGCLDLCQQIKSQTQIAWIYCIVLDSHPVKDASALWQLWQSELTVKTNLLEAGADAYICLYSSPMVGTRVDPDFVLAQQQFLVAQVGVGLQRVQTHRDLMRANDVLSAIALSDPLTELNNRRAFEWELPRQIHNARARGTPISLLMLDVDFFKQINDTYGHLIGDRALEVIAARLRHNLRFYDTPFRYGGEEFVVLLSDTASQEAEAIANRICRLISDRPFIINDTLDLHITISAGVASLLSYDDPRGISLLRRADRNLLKAKARGRNCAVNEEEEG
jgi:two-component system, cell cycle response regulator